MQEGIAIENPSRNDVTARLPLLDPPAETVVVVNVDFAVRVRFLDDLVEAVIDVDMMAHHWIGDRASSTRVVDVVDGRALRPDNAAHLTERTTREKSLRWANAIEIRCFEGLRHETRRVVHG